MRKLIYGCGYLGLRVARRWLAEGHAVDAVTRSPRRVAELRQQGVQPIVNDVLCPTALPRLDDYDTVLYAIGYDRQGGASLRAVYVEGLRAVLISAAAPPRRFIYISSTGVYGDARGEWIDERFECHPLREGGRVCLAAERELLARSCGQRSIVLRLAGLYGPGRVPRQQELLAGQPLATSQEGTLNLIHVDDAVEVVLAAEQFAPLPSIYVVSDGAPVSRDEYFSGMAELLRAAPPRFERLGPDAPGVERARSNRRISNAKMLRELHVALRYPNYRAGLAAILAAERPNRDSQQAK